MTIVSLNGFIEKRISNASNYRSSFSKYSDFFSFQETTKDAKNSHFGFPFVVKKNNFFNRNEICKYLNNSGIETRPIIAGNIARQPANALFNHRISGELLNSDIIMDNGFSIGVHQSLCNESMDYVKEIFDNFFKERKLS